MQTKQLGILSGLCLIGTVLWLVFMIAGMAGAGPLDTFEQVLSYVSEAGVIYYLTYINAALITVLVLLLFAGLYLHYKPVAPFWVLSGIIFVPVYGMMNLIVYLSQITVVPRMLQLITIPEYQTMAQFLLQQGIQQWPGSAISVVNNLAYAVLGIPSIFFGVLMYRAGSMVRRGGIFLILNGVACMAGFVGIIMQNAWLSNGSLAGGVLFLLALVCMSWGYGVGKAGQRTE